jgi:hypothetical protein
MKCEGINSLGNVRYCIIILAVKGTIFPKEKRNV